MRRTKIVCTIGPASDPPAVLRAMIEAGMDVARLNFSHGTLDEQHGRVQRIRTLAAELGRTVAILGDLAGPKLRTGAMHRESVILNAGDPFVLSDRPIVGDWRGASVSFSGLRDAVKPGEVILLNDGAIRLVVETVGADSVITRVQVGGCLGSHKGVNIPGRSISVESLTGKDREDIAFAVEHALDWLALSFVRTAADVQAACTRIAACGGRIPVIAKIEKCEAIDSLDAIVHAADGVMVARGDLGVEMDLADVPFIQKTVIARALAGEVPVITATHMLESMIETPRPTRAEATDVATAVLDGSDAVMLSEETAAGRYPVEAVQMMVRLVERAERAIDRGRFMSLGREESDVAGSVAKVACTLAAEVGAAAILVPTSEGAAPLQVASRRPSQPIIAITHDDRVRARLALSWGVIGLSAPDQAAAAGEQSLTRLCVEAARAAGLVRVDDWVVVTRGTRNEGRNLIEVVRVT